MGNSVLSLHIFYKDKSIHFFKDLGEVHQLPARGKPLGLLSTLLGLLDCGDGVGGLVRKEGGARSGAQLQKHVLKGMKTPGGNLCLT